MNNAVDTVITSLKKRQFTWHCELYYVVRDDISTFIYLLAVGLSVPDTMQDLSLYVPADFWIGERFDKIDTFCVIKLG